MSCPDWSGLVARRDAEISGEAAWDDALVHFDGCPHCREEALRAEPTLLFRTLRRPSGETGPGDDVATMQQAVTALRRAREIDPLPRRRFGMSPTLRLAAALAALLGATLLGMTVLGPGGVEDEIAPALSAAAGRSSEVSDEIAKDVLRPATLDLSHIPLVEDVDPELGSLVQLDDQEVSIVMVLAQATTGQGNV